ncbi:MAG TPA: glycine zipper 2TM domain-containing protein [Magnetospirillaceae bacterium]|nr:glycine zipper 2TM domain-containing protein [Magnetospirillaceae bacterium]
MARSLKICLVLGSLSLLTACGGTDYSPNTYASGAAQSASKVDAGFVIGFREVMISANGTVGAVTGGAAGGVLGSQAGSNGLDNALGGVIGSAVGSIVGSTIEHVTGDTKGWEYIVKKRNGDMLSVTQTEPKPLALGQKVLVINGAQQSRVIPDYSVDIQIEKTAAEKAADEKERLAQEKAKADTEKAQADAEKAKADAERAKAEAEKAQADAARARAEAVKPAPDAPPPAPANQDQQPTPPPQ